MVYLVGFCTRIHLLNFLTNIFKAAHESISWTRTSEIDYIRFYYCSNLYPLPAQTPPLYSWWNVRSEQCLKSLTVLVCVLISVNTGRVWWASYSGKLQEEKNHSSGLHSTSPTHRTTPKIQLANTDVSITVFISRALEIWGTRPLWCEVQLNFSAQLSSIVDVGAVLLWFWLSRLRNIYKRWSVWTRLTGFRLQLVDLLFSVLVTAEELA